MPGTGSEACARTEHGRLTAVRDAAQVREPELTFPLFHGRRVVSLDVSGRTSRRRGSGDEVAGSRPYRRGDAVRLVDWRASARLSTARASDEFVVRERFAEDVVRVLLIVDRGPSMALFPASLPWLRKQEVVRVAGRMILASSRAAHALVGYADCGPEGPRVQRPVRDRALVRLLEQRLAHDSADGPPQGLDATLTQLTAFPAGVPAGTFVFMLSDFLVPPRLDLLHTALTAGWDVVPVLIQDPVWERSFPAVSGVTLPLADPGTGIVRLVRLRSVETRERRERNEARARQLADTFLSLGAEPVLLTSSDPRAVQTAFLGWARARTGLARRVR